MVDSQTKPLSLQYLKYTCPPPPLCLLDWCLLVLSDSLELWLAFVVMLEGGVAGGGGLGVH